MKEIALLDCRLQKSFCAEACTQSSTPYTIRAVSPLRQLCAHPHVDVHHSHHQPHQGAQEALAHREHIGCGSNSAGTLTLCARGAHERPGLSSTDRRGPISSPLSCSLSSKSSCIPPRLAPFSLHPPPSTRAPSKRLEIRSDAALSKPLTVAATASPLKEREALEAPPSFDYNEKMKRQMANPYEYHHELGMYYTRITSHVIVGSQPQTPDDVTYLKEREGVDVVLNLQEDRDVAYWGVDLLAIQRRCRELGVEHTRQPAVDFDAHSLRRQLPAMVAVIACAVAQGKTVYVHCTAGLGRSPAAVIAYLFWFGKPPQQQDEEQHQSSLLQPPASSINLDLRTAYDFVTAKRPCGPKWDAIRGATYDLAKNSPYQPSFDALPEVAFTDVAQWERDLIRQRVWNCTR